ncbi:DNA translocase FtsK [Ruminococcus albus]|uniref:DNA segregation ATPase FtsK/SpoIIIE, S-DNA-T family n=1 Tax=Ruminococcus albus TaxID=1264 RepID=A0A1I1MJS8_RUMAL|nr:DNA translocase FtsK [Ruminococcus albus]SFC85669.1 DNA segregation ATPase FtsK/SpoIIIE, S-DNA-T family [Ruminococcus albus]
MAANAPGSKTTGRPAQKKQTAQSSPKVSKAAQDALNAAREREFRRFWSYILFFTGVLELFITFIKGDGLWRALHDLNRGLFGVAVFLFAPMMIYVALMIASNTKKNTVVAKCVEGGVLMLLSSGMVQILQVGSVQGGNFFKKLKGLYDDGVELRGGGLASAVLGWPLLAAFKRLGASIIILLIAFTFILLLTDLTLPQLFKLLSRPFVASVEAVRTDRVERVVARQEREGQLGNGDNEMRRRPGLPAPAAMDEPVQRGKQRVDFAKFVTDDDTVAEHEVEEIIDNGETIVDDIKPSRKKRDLSKAEEVSVEIIEEETPDDSEDREELKKIIEAAVNRKNSPASDNEDKPDLPKVVNINSKGQTTMFEEDEKIPVYVNPPVDVLKYPKKKIDKAIIEAEIQEKSRKLVETLEVYGVKTRITGIFRGPSVTRYELQPAAGVKVAKILSLADDIALNLAALSIRIEAPVPGKPCVGIEVPNDVRDPVSLRELIDSDEYRNAKGKLTFAVGKDIEGKIVVGNIAKMPHLLVAGTTGSGKSVFTNSIIMSVLYHASPEEVKLILIDPKMVEFKLYDRIPHLLIPVVTDPLKAAGALGWAVNEMNKRYKMFEANNVKNLEEFNEMLTAEHSKPVDEIDPMFAKMKLMPQILIVIDEFADLMMAAGSEVEDSVIRLGQLARAAGIHMVIATQSPRKDVITGLIKSNIPSRVSLSVSSNVDSRVIMDQGGAEKLLGNGDLLYKPVGVKTPIRIQSGFADTPEIKSVVEFLKSEHSAEYSADIMAEVEENMPKPKEDKKSGGNSDSEDVIINPDDDLIDQAITVIVSTGNASTSYLQRKLKLGFSRASRIMDQIEEMGIIGPQEGAKPRKINLTEEEWLEMRARR